MNAIHFVGFRGDEFNRAIKVFGKPDFIHRNFDTRVFGGGEFDKDNDIVIFANSSDAKTPSPFAFDDSSVF